MRSSKNARQGVYLSISYIPKRKRKPIRQSFTGDSLEYVLAQARTFLGDTDKVCSAWYQPCEIWDEEGYSMFQIEIYAPTTNLDCAVFNREACAV